MAPPDTWREYSDGEFPSDVYGYVPVELVESFIESHGGGVKTMEEIKNVTYRQIVDEVREVVTAYRRRLEGVWTTPSRKHCLMFAATESAEAIDAYLRQHPEYSRNNAKDISIIEEVSDCLMMLLSSGMEYAPYLMNDTIRKREEVIEDELIRLNCEVAYSVITCSSNAFSASLRAAIDILGPDAVSHVEKRLQRIEAKHAQSKHAQLNVKGKDDVEWEVTE